MGVVDYDFMIHPLINQFLNVRDLGKRRNQV